MSTVSIEAVRTRGRRCAYAGAMATIFFLWIILIFAELGFHFAARDQAQTGGTYHHQSFRSPPRKARFFDTRSSLHASSSSSNSAQFMDNESDPADTLYEDDKRIVHTGPNPLHN